MNPTRWRLIRNLALLIALVVTAIQLYFVGPVFLELFERLSIGNNVNPPVDNPENEARMRTAMLLQTVGLPSWVLAFVGWRMARTPGSTQDNH